MKMESDKQAHITHVHQACRHLGFIW